MNRLKISRSVSAFLVCFALLLFYIYGWFRCPALYKSDYGILVLCHLFMSAAFMWIVSKKTFYAFEPIVFVTLMYYLIFVLMPIINILTNNLYVFGYNPMGGCVKATFIFLLGYVALFFGYYLFDKKKAGEREVREEYDKKDLLLYSWIVWVAAIAIYLLYNQLIGRSVLYMLSFGFLGGGSIGSSSFTVDFLSMIVYCSFFPMMNIFNYSQSKWVKLLVLYVTCVPLATRGFRSVLIIPLLAPFIYHYLKKKKTPSFKMFCLVLALIILMIGAIGYARGSLRVGEGADFEGYEYSDGVEGMLDYLGSYKVFYSAVEKYPAQYDYTMGQQLAYSVIMYIPRAIWPEKPAAPVQEAIGNAVNGIAKEAGSTWPNLGEYYTDLGVFGVALIMFLLGMILAKMKKLYESGRVTSSSLSMYSLLLPGLLPIIAYGYTAGNLPTIVFMALPLLGQKILLKKKTNGK